MRLSVKILPLVCLLAWALLPNTSHAQSRDNFTTSLSVGGAVINAKKARPIKDAVVELRSGTKVLESLNTPKTGSFEFQLTWDRTYTLYIAADGFAPQIVEISTKGLNDQDKYYDYEYAGVICRLATLVEGVDYTMFDEPVMKLAFDSEAQRFAPDAEYDKMVKEKRIALDKAIVGQ